MMVTTCLFSLPSLPCHQLNDWEQIEIDKRIIIADVKPNMCLSSRVNCGFLSPLNAYRNNLLYSILTKVKVDGEKAA